ncbi:Copper, lead, cadmium, zinc and mercury transporting ATPase [Anaerovibrio sp. JC8]|uniref:HAD family hydrolase n=1 Tax=Anaerovibrio sp. JC8 TaxID=1240085 RepID=UPI000A0A330D|nr:HAD family hydrolase [Anaerovibrio sp. JC8]ORU01472.1 Copper, lead, cadmium, zinc and mercury transporting ATPase [Anaerovibrio sp. JC8]
MFDMLLENRLIFYGMIVGIFILINFVAYILLKFILPWQAMRTLRRFNIHARSRKLLPLLHLTGQLVMGLSGAVTKGVPVIYDIIPAGIAPSKLMTFAASAEAGVKHPLAEAVAEWADEKRLELSEASASNIVPGKGVEALINHQEVRVGTAAFLQDHDVKIPAEILTKADQMAGKGNVVSFVSIGGFCRGFIVFSDALRPTVPGAVQTLREYGISTSIMTSAAGSTARNIARQAGISNVQAELDTMEKAKKITIMKNTDSLIGAVATTRNTHVLAQSADISFALSVTDESIKEQCDIYVDSVDFGNIMSAVDIAKYTYSKRKTGIIVTVLFNLVLGAITSYIVAEPALPFFAPVLPILAGVLFLIGILANQFTYNY